MSTRKSPRQNETLPGITAPIAVSELKRPRSFLTVTRPGLWGKDPADFTDITTHMLELADPEAFRDDLIGKRRGKDPEDEDFIVDYELDDGSREHVSLHPGEYKVFYRPFNPGHLKAKVAADIKSGNYSLASRKIQDGKTAKVGNQALLSVQQAMQERVDRTLLPEKNLLERLTEASRSDRLGLSRGHTETLRADISTVLGFIVPNMLVVVGNQRKWDDEKAARAMRSLESRLFFAPNDVARVREWNRLFNVLRDYDQHKINAFKDRIGRIEGYLGRIAPKADQAAS